MTFFLYSPSVRFWRLWNYLSCTKCHKQGHTPHTIALDPLLFDRKVTDGGVSFNKKPPRVMSACFYVCQGSGDLFNQREARRAREEYAANDRANEAKGRRRRGLVANLTAATSPAADAVGTLEEIESLASAVAPANKVTKQEQARLVE